MIKNNRMIPKPIVFPSEINEYGCCPNNHCQAPVKSDDKFCRKCGQALMPPSDAPVTEPNMIYFKGLVQGSSNKWVYGAHFYDGQRNYIITAIPGTNLVIRGHRSDDVTIYAVNPDSVEIVQPDELCPNCDKPILKALWHDIAKYNGKSIPLKTVVELDSNSGTYDLEGLSKIFEALYSLDPNQFTEADEEETGIPAEDIGPHCLRCGAILQLKTVI